MEHGRGGGMCYGECLWLCWQWCANM